MANSKLVILVSHPIPYQVPFFRKLARQPTVDLTVYFCDNFGTGEPQFYPEFGGKVSWDMSLLGGYKHTFLKNYSPHPTVFNFFGLINFGIIKELIRNRPDAIWLHGWNSVTNWLAMIAALILGVPVGIHGDNSFMSERKKPLWKIKVKKIIFGRLLFRGISAFFYIGAEDKKFYEFYGVPPEKLFFTPFATDNEWFFGESEKLLPQKELLRKKFNIDSRGMVTIFVGKLIERKRPMDLIKAHQLIGKNDQASLVLIGDGALRKDLEQYVSDNKLENVHFFGFKNLTEISEFYALADIFVIPSSNEVWGIVVNEAMCFGLPVIASDTVGAVSDLVKHDQNGFVYPEGDVETLSRCLRELMESKKKRIAFGEQSSEIIRRYSHEADVQAIMNFLKTVNRAKS